MSVIDKLLAVQEWDSRIRDMEKEIRDIPARKDLELARLEEHRQRLAEAEQALKARLAEIKELEVEAESHRDKIVKFRQQQFEIKTNKEFKAIESEIATVQAGISRLEDKELELMMNAERAKAEVEASRTSLAAEDQAVQADVKAWDQRAAELEKEVEGAHEQRRTAAAEIGPDWLVSYERIFERKDKALVPVEGGICGGCHMQLPPFIVHGARQHDAMVYCTYCGRLVY